jgi:hypothetical protein
MHQQQHADFLLVPCRNEWETVMEEETRVAIATVLMYGKPPLPSFTYNPSTTNGIRCLIIVKKRYLLLLICALLFLWQQGAMQNELSAGFELSAIGLIIPEAAQWRLGWKSKAMCVSSKWWLGKDTDSPFCPAGHRSWRHSFSGRCTVCIMYLSINSKATLQTGCSAIIGWSAERKSFWHTNSSSLISLS